MSFDSVETSVQDGYRVELYTITTPLLSYYLTGHNEDVELGGITYAATAVSHSNTAKMPMGRDNEVTVSLPVDHACVATLLGNGIPPRLITVTIRQAHMTDSGLTDVRRRWGGYVAGIRTNNVVAELRVPSATMEAFNVRLPVVAAQRTCNHVLYDEGCRVDRDYATWATQGFLVAATVSSISADGLTIGISTMGGHEDSWARLGEVVRLVDREPRSVLEQVGTTLTIDVPFGDLDVGDELEVWAGCDFAVTTCKNKFNNVVNFGGHPQLPTRNPSSRLWFPQGSD